MNNSAACLIFATTFLAAATLPLASVAQETAPSETTVEATPGAQRRFVSDKLVLNVYAEVEQGSARVATIQTGDAVEELERSGNQVRVRLEDGREGWVGASYLVSDEPAIVRLRELQRQQPGLTPAPRVDKVSADEIAQLKKENAALRGQVTALQARPVTPVAAPVECEEVEAPIQAAAFPTVAPTGSIWGWLTALIFVGGAGFAGGYQTLARRLRKKFGGLKVY
ncbi:MAG TPA: SH3 domain-containing protein [Steroidobacter sp.]